MKQILEFGRMPIDELHACYFHVRMSFTLDPDSDQMRRLIERASERVIDHLERLAEQPASYDGTGGEQLAQTLAEDWPQTVDLEEALDQVFDRALTRTFNTAHPGYLGFIPGGGLYYSAVADYIADAVNRYTTVWLAAPGLVQLETNVLRWLCRIVGYPDEALGLVTTGGSMAQLTAVVTAREEKLGEAIGTGTVYVSDQAHYCVDKAVRIAGIPLSNIRQIPTDAAFRIRLDELEKQIEADRAAGLRPFLMVANAGTTNSGAVDDLPAVAELCRRQDLWLNVDAAYGGFFMLTEEGREVMRGLELADSIVLDPHKGMFLPYGTGCLLVRDAEALRRSHAESGDYMPRMQHSGERVDFCQLGPELSREYRGLRLWLPLKLLGFEAFAAALEQKLELARSAEQRIRALPDVEILAPRQLSLFAFRHRPDGLDGDALDRHNRDWMERVNRRERVFLTGTVLRQQFAIRVCVLHLRTGPEQIDALLEDLLAEFRTPQLSEAALRAEPATPKAEVME